MTLLEEPKLQEPDIGSPDDKAHLCRKEDIARAAVEGGKVKALCGVMFEPIRDPTGFPVCQGCVDVHNQLMARGLS